MLEGTSDITITGNVFSGLAGEAIRADAACRRLVVANNILTDLNRKTPGQGKAIDLGGAQEVFESQNLGTTPSK